MHKYRIVALTIGLEAFQIISDDWSEDKWKHTIFVMGYNPTLADYVIKHKGGIIVITRSAQSYFSYLKSKETDSGFTRVKTCGSFSELIYK